MATTLERLLTLGPVFTLYELREQGLKDGNAYAWLLRTVNAGHIMSAGARSGVYYNLVRDPEVVGKRRLEAVARLHSTAVVVGAAVLHAYGWVDRAPAEIDVAILKQPTTRAIDGVRIVMREQAWHRDHGSELLRDDAFFPIPSLRPEHALADVLSAKDLTLPVDPADITDPRSQLVRPRRTRP